MSKSKIVSIYKLTFEDGAEYVGQTILEVASRVAAHAHNPANYELHQRLNRGDEFKTTILTRAVIEHAHVVEAREIAKLKKPINITHAKTEPVGERSPPGYRRMGKWGTGKKIPYPRRTSGSFRCHVCGGWYGPENFGTDSQRSSGLASKCLPCRRALTNGVLPRSEKWDKFGTSLCRNEGKIEEKL